MLLSRYRLFRCSLALMAIALLSLTTSHALAEKANAVTFEKVLEYVQLEVSESKIIKLVEASPTVFVLGADQVDTLRKAGASEALIEKMQKKTAPVAVGSDVSEFVLVLDCSGSMNDKLPDGGSKWQAARQAAVDLIKSIPDGRRLALVVYGTDVERQCQSVDVLQELTELNGASKSKLTATVMALKAVGHTPIATALQTAGEQLESAVGMASVILITDGMETCHGDPAAEAARLAEKIPKLRGGVNVIGFCLSDKESSQVEQIARAGKGQFHDAKTAKELVASVKKVEKALVKAKLVDEVNLEVLSELDRAIVEQLSDPSMSVRESAAKTVVERKLTAAEPALIKLIMDVEWTTAIYNENDRDAALAGLLALAPDKVAPLLSETISSPTYKTRMWSAHAIVKHDIKGAAGGIEARLTAMGDADITSSLVNGTDEADAMFAALQKVAPDRLQSLMLKLLKSDSSTKKAWASAKVRELK